MPNPFLSLIPLLGAALAAQAPIPLPGATGTEPPLDGIEFTCPAPITILGMRAPGNGTPGPQQLVLQVNTPMPGYLPQTGTEVLRASVVQGAVVPCFQPVYQGQGVAAFGSCGTASTIAAGQAALTTIGGQQQLVFGARSNGPLAAGPVSYTWNGSLGLVELYYLPGWLEQGTMPAQTGMSSSQVTRGYCFQVPHGMVITGVRVPDLSMLGVQSVEILRLPGAPGSGTNQPGSSEVIAAGVPSHQVVPCNIAVRTGEWIAVFGGCGSTTQSVGTGTPAANGTFSMTFDGRATTCTPLAMNGNLATGPGHTPFVIDASGAAPRIEVFYQPGTGTASATAYGQGCGGASRAFYEDVTSANFTLANHSLTMHYSAGHYQVHAGGAWMTPPASATTLALSDDSEVLVQLPNSFPFPGGYTNTLVVCSNGYVSAGFGNVPAVSMDVYTWLHGYQARWGCVHDYNPAASGSGQVTYCSAPSCWGIENRSQSPRRPRTRHLAMPGNSGAPHYHLVGNVACCTWNGVFDYVFNTPSWFQIQFDYSTGEVRYVWRGMSTSPGQYFTGFAPAGPSSDYGGISLATALPQGFSTSPLDAESLALTSSAPLLGTTLQTTTTNLMPGAGFGFRLLGLQSVAGQPLDGYGAPGCYQYVAPIATELFLAVGPSATMPLTLPLRSELIGCHVYAQSAAPAPYVNALGFSFSNGVDLRLDLN